MLALFTQKRERLAFPTRLAGVTAVMCCLFAGNGIVLPYLSRWLEADRHLHGAEIGAVLSLAQLTRLAVGPMIALWADGALDRRMPIRVLSIAASLAFAGFFFLAHDFQSLLIWGFAALTLSQGLSPFVEGAVLRASEEGRISYGLARGMGSAAFIVANVLGGATIARFGPGAVVAWVLSTYALLVITSWTGLKHEPAPVEAHGVPLRERVKSAAALLRTRRFVILIIACGFIQSAHAFYYGFATLVWRGQGIDAGTVGLLWGFGVTAEVAFLWSLPLIERRLQPEVLIVMGGAGATVRWLLMSFAPTGFVLWPIQALHALSFASSHVGAMRLIYRETPQAAAGLAQTLYAALSAGLFMGLSTLLSGVLYDAIGAHGYWVMSGIALTGAAIASQLLKSAPAGTALLSGEHRP